MPRAVTIRSLPKAFEFVKAMRADGLEWRGLPKPSAAGEYRTEKLRPNAVSRRRRHQLRPSVRHNGCADWPLMLLIGAAVLLKTVAIVLLVGYYVLHRRE